MSILTNVNQGTEVFSSTYNNPIVDLLKRINIDDSALPVIRSGFQVTPASGLNVNVSAGSAKGQYITFTQMNVVYQGAPTSVSLPTDVAITTGTVVSVPDNSTGWIVLNININPAPTSAPSGAPGTGFYYTVQADNNTGMTPTVTPVFVSSLSPSVGSSYPYTQIVLCAVTSASGAITDIDNSQRSFDWTQFLSGGDCGDTILSYASKGSGWIQMNDGSIGSPSSGATTLASNSAYNLYRLLWNSVLDSFCPVVGGRGTSAFADFYANKAMVLPATAGRAMCAGGQPQFTQIFTASGNILTVPAVGGIFWPGTPVTVSNTGGALPSPLAPATTYYAIPLSGTTLSLATTVANALAGTAITLTTTGSGINIIVAGYVPFIPGVGQPYGEVNHVQTNNELVPHLHPNSAGELGNNHYGSSYEGGAGVDQGEPFNTGTTGGGSPFNIMQPSTFLPAWIHL